MIRQQNFGVVLASLYNELESFISCISWISIFHEFLIINVCDELLCVYSRWIQALFSKAEPNELKPIGVPHALAFSYEIKLLSLDFHTGETKKKVHHLFVSAERRYDKTISPRRNRWCIGKIQGVLACTDNWPHKQANISPHEASITADGSVKSGLPIKKTEKRRFFA